MSEIAVNAIHGETLFELAQWCARVQQYSSSHPACAQLGERTRAALTKSLAVASPLTIDVLKDGMSVGLLPVTHMAVRTRLAPQLHERGVLVLTFLAGVGVPELTALVEVLSMPVQSTFDRGGVRALLLERGVSRIQVEEIAHEISTDERAAQRVRTRLRTRFAGVLRELVARRSMAGLTGEELVELLDHPDIAVTILEEDHLAIAETFAGLCLMVRDAERRTGVELSPELRAILMALSPASHDRLLLGVPTLVSEFRDAVTWALDGTSEAELARIVLASLRTHAADLDPALYAVSVVIPHGGRRLSVLRRVALHFYDLPWDDASAVDLVTYCAIAAPEVDSYSRERECLQLDATRVLGRRAAFERVAPPVEPTERAHDAELAADQRRVTSELVKMASRTRRFEQLCHRLPQSAVTLSRAGSSHAVLGILDGLRSVTRPEFVPHARTTLRAVVSPSVASQLLADVDAASATIDDAAFEDAATTVRLLTALAPEAVFEQLELSESRKMRRVLLEALAAAGPGLLPVLREKLRGSSWFVVRNAVSLVPRVGGAARDLSPVALHPNEKVRHEVLRALRAVPPDGAMMDIVVAYLTDVAADVRQPAATMLRGELLTVEAIGRLEKIALGEEHPEELRLRVVSALGHCPLDAAATALFTLLQPRGLLDLGSLRDHVAVALRGSPAPLGPGYFAEGLQSPVRRVRKACERAAGASS